MQQAKLTPTQKKRKRLLGDVFLGLENGNFGALLPGWHDHGSISAIDVNTGRQVWKFQTPEPERGGVTTTDSGLGFAGGGDGVLRAFDLKTGKVLWTFQTGHQIAAGPSIYSVDGKEYIAITSGGTPTSSNGGIASELQIFALGGSKSESKPPLRTLVSRRRARHASDGDARSSAGCRDRNRRTRDGLARAAPDGCACRRGLVVRPWNANSNNDRTRSGTLLLGGASGRGRARHRRRLPGSAPPRRTASFHYRADITSRAGMSSRSSTSRRRHDRRPAALERAESGGAGAHGGFSVGYGFDGLKATRAANGTSSSPAACRLSGAAPPRGRALHLPAHRHDHRRGRQARAGRGRRHAHADRDFWTFSSAERRERPLHLVLLRLRRDGADPVPLAVGVALGAALLRRHARSRTPTSSGCAARR